VSNKTLFVLACGLSLHLPAFAAITCCEIDGKRYCGNPPPAQCVGRAQTVTKGGVTRAVETPPTAEQRAARDAEEALKKEEEKKALEQRRRDRALLDSFTSLAEIDKAQKRAMAELEKHVDQANNRIAAAQARLQKIETEKEFYASKPLPGPLQRQIRENEKEIAEQGMILAEKKRGIEAVRKRFEADKERYRRLTGKQ